MPWRRSFDENIVYTDWRRDNYFYAVQKVLEDAGIKKGRLGIEEDHVSVDLRRKFTRRISKL